MIANQGANQIESVGLQTTTPAWAKFQATGNELVDRAFLDVVRAESEAQARAAFDGFVSDWNSSGGAAATAEMSAALSAAYGQ